MSCSRRIALLRCALASCVGLAGCSGFVSPRATTLATVSPCALARLLPGAFEIELDSPGLGGTFDAVCAVASQSFRLQLFPEVGGKVFDVTVGADAVTAEWPGGRYAAAAPLDRAEPHLALVLAAVCAELLAPVDAARVRGERAVDGGLEVDLRPALGSGRVAARLAADGSVASYRVTLGWIEFELGADGRFAGRGASGQLRPRGG